MNTTLNTFAWLLWRDTRALKKIFLNQWLDYSFLLSIVATLNNYIMPTFGMPTTYGVHMLIGQATASLAWSIHGDIGTLAYDLQGPRTISYELTLPISYRLVYLKYLCAYALKAIIINAAALPVASLFIINSIDFSLISPIKLLIAYPLAAATFVSFGSFTAMLSKNVEAFNQFWMRWGMAIWMFSGLFTPWGIMYKTSVWVGYATLFNPLIYAFEATHAAFMGQSQFINFWVCCAAMIGSSILFTASGLYLFKKRMDCV